MATVDLDALAAELTAAGYKAWITETAYPENGQGRWVTAVPSNGALASLTINENNMSVSDDDAGFIDFETLDIIRRHVSPEPSRRAAVDVDAVLKQVDRFGDLRASAALAQARSSVPSQAAMHYDDADKQFAAIRAMLEPHDGARLRDTIAEALRNQWVRYCDEVGDTDVSHVLAWAELPDDHKERWFEMSDAVIRAIGGAR